MKQEFEGYGGDTITINFEGETVNYAALEDAIKSTKIDLRPGQLEEQNKVYFAVLPPLSSTGQPDDPNAMLRLATMTCKGKTLLALCRDAVDVFMKKYYGMEVPSLGAEPVFDCKMASYMVMVHQALIGPAGDIDFMPLGREEFLGLMNEHPQVGAMLSGVVESTQEFPTEYREFKGYTTAITASQDLAFNEAPIPADCKGSGVKPVDVKEEGKEGSGWLAPVAVVVGIGGVAALWWAMSRKPKAQAPRAVR